MTSYPHPSRTAQINGVDLVWDAYGDDTAPTLLLCHGFSGSAHDFVMQVPSLTAAGYRVVVMEHRGHGHSGHGPADGYRIAQLADDLLALLPQMTDRPLHLLGHSMGGIVSLEATLKDHSLIKSLIMMDTSAFTFRPLDPAMAQMLDAFIGSYDPAGGLPDIPITGPEEDLVAKVTPEDWRTAKEEDWARLDPYALKGLGAELMVDGITEHGDDLKGFPVPLTVIVGRHDEPYMSQAPRLIELTGGHLSVIEEAYHSPQLTHPDAWREAVLDHLRRAER